MSLTETCEHVAHKDHIIIYPLEIHQIRFLQKENIDYIGVSDLHELKIVAASLKKPMFYDVNYYYVILDNDIAYRTKRYDKIYRTYDI